MTERQYWLYMSRVIGIDTRRKQLALEMFGGPEGVYRAGEEQLKKCPALEEKHIGQLLVFRNEDFAAEEEKLAEAGINFVTYLDAEYPEKLRYLPDMPLTLFYRGSLPEKCRPSVAIVGSRKCSFYGREMCLDFAKRLAECKIDIISGMALGVDGFAHRGAMEAGGKTYAVLGSGADVCYPAQNRDIYRRLSEPDGAGGGIISEYYPGTAPLPMLFPPRNRIISGLADVLLVVEARLHSGTAITVGHALEQGKEVFAIPGRIGDSISDGCNQLIKNGARLTTGPEDIVEELKTQYEILLQVEKKKKKNLRAGLSGEEQKIYKELSLQPVTINELSVRTGLSCGVISKSIVRLEMMDLAEEVGKNSYIGR